MNIAALCTAYWPASHADVIVSRWLQPFPGDERWGWQPKTRIASLHIAQRQPNDGAHWLDVPPAERGFSRGTEIGVPTALRHGVPLFDSIRGALTLGGTALAVDGVLLIGEHGDYPHNPLGQHLYPRKEMFDAIVSVFRQSGRCVPVFVDKHLSWNGAWAREMVQTARDMGFALMAGSSLPYTLPVAQQVPAGDAHSFYHHFAVLDGIIERMFLTGRAQAPVQRTLLTTLMIERVMHALAEPGVRRETPDLHISYSQVE